MQDLFTLPGDSGSAGLGMNNRDEVVGVSTSGGGASVSPRAFLWRNGVMHDLNNLTTDSPLSLLIAFAINDVGEIAGFGVTSTFEVHGFLATPRRAAD